MMLIVKFDLTIPKTYTFLKYVYNIIPSSLTPLLRALARHNFKDTSSLNRSNSWNE